VKERGNILNGNGYCGLIHRTGWICAPGTLHGMPCHPMLDILKCAISTRQAWGIVFL